MPAWRRLLCIGNRGLIGLCLTMGIIQVLGKGPEKVSYASGIQIELIRTSTLTFSNVLVYSRDSQNVFFEHIGGLGSVKVAELDSATLRRLGLEVETASKSPGSALWGFLNPASWLVVARDASPLGLTSIAVILILILGLYLYCSFLFWMLCLKVGAEPGISVWLPVVQILPLLRAAKMSAIGPVFLLLLLVASVLLRPHFGPYAWTLAVASALASFMCFLTWSIKICQVRSKSPIIAGLLLVPGVNFFALLYLASSK